MFDFIIGQRFAPDSSLPLPYLAHSGHYVLRRLPSYKEVPHSAPLASVFRPGSHLVMTLIMGWDDKYERCCPGCDNPDEGVENVTYNCRCGVLYTRAIEPKEHILMLPAHTKAVEQPDDSHHTCDDREFEQRAPRSMFHGPGPKPIQQEAWDLEVPPFHDVTVAKNVDFATPAMVCLTDLFGYIYMVPWRVIRQAAGLTFFLQWFTAGGPLFQWSQDYHLLDDDGTVLREEIWETHAYPGISIKMVRRHDGCNKTLREEITSRIEYALSTSHLVSKTSSIDDAVHNACLLFSTAPSQTEVREAILDSVSAFLQKSPRSDSPSCKAPTIDESRKFCLICRKGLRTHLAFKDHVRSHLYALRCSKDCVACDTAGLPSVIGKDVDQGQAADRQQLLVSTTEI